MVNNNDQTCKCCGNLFKVRNDNPGGYCFSCAYELKQAQTRGYLEHFFKGENQE